MQSFNSGSYRSFYDWINRRIYGHEILVSFSPWLDVRADFIFILFYTTNGI